MLPIVARFARTVEIDRTPRRLYSPAVADARKRRIKVDGVDYQWVVRPVDAGHVVVRVWRMGAVRRRQLEVRLAFDDPWLNFGPIITAPKDRVAEVFALSPVTSALTARLVRLGLAAGWQTDSQGRPMSFTLDRTRRELTPAPDPTP